MRIVKILLLLGALLPAFSQERAMPPRYRLKFTFTDAMQQKKLNQMQYTLLVEENSKSKINIGSRIPYMPAGTGDKQVHMVAVGVIVECQVRPRGPMVGLDCAFESSAVAPDQPKPSAGFPPVLNTQQASVVTAVPPGKTVTIASLDDPKTKHNLEISVHVDKEE